MLIKTITYTDFEGTKRTEEFHFNLMESELTEMNLSTHGGLEKELKRIIDSQNEAEIIATFKNIILKSYGIISNEGRRFMKSEELSTAFSQTNAYSKLYMELATDSKAAAEFINGIVPDEYRTPEEPPILTPVPSNDSAKATTE